MATVDTKKMKEIATNMSSAVHELNENIQKLVEATKSAQALKDTARGYDGKELTGNEERTTYGKDDDKLKIVKYYAHVNNSEGGMCSSGMRSITGAPKEYAFLQINKILDLTDADIDAVIESINSNIDEVETTLAKLEGQNATGSNQATDSNQSTDTNQATETGDNSGGNDYPSGGGGGSTGGGGGSTGGGGGSTGGGGGGSTGGTPQYKKTSTEKPSTTPSTKPKTKSNDNTTRTNNSNNITFTNTSNNSSSTVKPNNSTTTTADKPSSTTPTTETNSDNPTPSASVVLGNSNKGTSSPNYTNGENNTTNTEIEVLGEEPPIKTPNPEDLGDSIINGISRVIPGIKSGEKVQTGSALIPGAAGITAAAAAGLGSKAVLDRSDNLLSIQNDDDDEDDNENHSNKDDETTKKKKNSDDKGWLYGMGVGLGAVGAAAAKNKYDKEKEEEDYGIADDTPEEPETLEDD